MASTRILIMAGGTGGHVFPALAVARQLAAQGVEVQWLGTQQGLEAKIVPQDNIKMNWINVSGLRGKGSLSWLLAPFKLCRALMQALKTVRSYRPNVVLGMGGFVSGPGGVAAWLLRKPLVIHEQNAIAGLTNKLLAPLAAKVVQAFPSAFSERKNVLTAGNPVRKEISAIVEPDERFTGRSDALRVLVVGGSLGAQVFNKTLPAALRQLPAAERPQLWHQTGAKHLEVAKEAYAKAGVAARIEPFIENMAEAYAWSDVVICRAGALTVSELAAAGVASVLVPFPYAVDDHQTANAKYLSEQGAAVLLAQKQFSEERLVELLRSFAEVGGREKLLNMAKAARQLAKVNATDDVAKLCMEYAHV